MRRIEESIEIKSPVDKVFAYTTDAKNWPKWQSFLPEAQQTSRTVTHIGLTIKGMMSPSGVPVASLGYLINLSTSVFHHQRSERQAGFSSCRCHQ